jgi:hypothetical protein
MTDDAHWQTQPKLLRCTICGSTEPCTDYEFMSYIWAGWPTCCGRTMALFVDVSPLISQISRE